jgi:pyruvate/2-oxoglutarate/acetoin dehydrogenase E1 component
LEYFGELKKSMDYLGRDDRVIVVGQAVEVPGTAMSTTLIDIPKGKLVELPVTEELQMGISIGLGLEGWVPLTVYPRWNFLLLAMNQLVNHLDKMQEISNGGYQTRVIVRTSIGSERPLHPQCQHVGDFTDGFRLICRNLDIVRLEEPGDIFPAYQHALNRDDGKSTILVEYGDYYNEK